MAVQTSMREVARRMGEAIGKFAASHQLSRASYSLAGAYDETNERISLFFCADREVDGMLFYKGILEAIREAFPESPYITMHVGLVVAGSQRPEELRSRFYANANEIDLTEWLEQA